jgi:hypothetical protein
MGGILAPGISVSKRLAKFGIFLPLVVYQATPLLEMPLSHGIRVVEARRVDAQRLKINKNL